MGTLSDISTMNLRHNDIYLVLVFMTNQPQFVILSRNSLFIKDNFRGNLASHAGVFRGARVSFLPTIGEGRNTSSPKKGCVGG